MGGVAMIISTLTIFAVTLNFIVVLIAIAKISRQVDTIQRSLTFIERKLKEEDVFVTKTNQTVDRIERELKDIEGEIEWKG